MYTLAGFLDDAIDPADQTYYNPTEEERNQWQCLPHQWHPRAPCTSVGHRMFWVNHRASPHGPDKPSEAWFARELSFRTDPPRIHNWFPTEESPVCTHVMTPWNPARYATQRVALPQQYPFHTTQARERERTGNIDTIRQPMRRGEWQANNNRPGSRRETTSPAETAQGTQPRNREPVYQRSLQHDTQHNGYMSLLTE